MTRSMGPPNADARAIRWGLAATLLVVGVSGIAGGAGLVSDPSGAAVGMSVDALAGSPFADYLVPGLVLLCINGLASATAGVAVLRRWRRAGAAGLALGIFLMGWIAIQVAIIGLVHWLQPLFFALGMVESGLALALGRR